MTAKASGTVKKAAPTPKRPAARRPRPAPALPLPGGEVGDFEPLRLVTGGEEPVKRVPLFYIDDKVYEIPAAMPIGDALDCLHVFRTQGEHFATDNLLGILLGEEGYAALRAYRGLTADNVAQIIQIAQKIMLGSIEAPKA